MTVRFRPYDPDRRFVWPLRSGRRGNGARWLALHRQPPDWDALFRRALDLMMIDASTAVSGLTIAGGAGRLRWRHGRLWSVIDLHGGGMSSKKRAVVAAALLKAARYTG